MTESGGQQSDQTAPTQQMSTQRVKDVEEMVLSHATDLAQDLAPNITLQPELDPNTGAVSM